MYKSNIRNAKKRGGKEERDRDFIVPDGCQTYALVQEMMGNGRLRALCEDGVLRVGRIRGSMRKYKNKVIIGRGDLVIVALREFDTENVDVIHKYTHNECSKLLMWKSLPESIHRAMTDRNDPDADGNPESEYVVFGNDGDIDVAFI
jgi:translation initiation factor 1A